MENILEMVNIDNNYIHQYIRADADYIKAVHDERITTRNYYEAEEGKFGYNIIRMYHWEGMKNTEDKLDIKNDYMRLVFENNDK